MSVSLLDKWRFAQAIVADPNLSPSARLVAVALLEFHNGKSGRCFPSYETIAAAAGLKRRATAIGAVRELEAAGWVGVEKRGRGKGGRSLTNNLSFAFERTRNGTENVPLEDENGTQNARNGTQNSTRILEEHTGYKPVCDDGRNTIDAAARGSGAADASPQAAASIEAGFAEFRRIYPKRTAEQAAWRVFRHVVTTGKATVVQILHAARQLAETKPNVRKLREPHQWLLDGCYTDELPPEPASKPQPSERRQSKSSRPKSAADVGADL